MALNSAQRESNGGPAILPEHVGAIRSVDSGQESAACGESGGTATAWEDVATSRACSNVARPGVEALGIDDAVHAMATVERAIAELDAGRVEVATARLKAFLAATRGRPGGGCPKNCVTGKFVVGS